MTIDPTALTPENFEAARQRMLAAKGTAPRRHARIDAKALLSVGASEFLALDPSAVGHAVALASEPSGTPAMRAAVGVVTVEGPLAQRAYFDLCAFVDGYDYITARLRAALADEAVDAVVLRIDSPGGDVAGLEEAVARMRAARDESAKPIVVYVDELAASAAYWIASGVASDGIYAPDAGRTGCIGVIGALVSEAKALEDEGISVTLIADPDGKAEGHPAIPTSKEAVARARARVGELAGRFFEAVAAARGLDAKDVRAMDGQTFLGAEAKRRGLIDGVQSFEATVALAAERGREARQKREQSMQTEKELARLQAFEKSAFEATGSKSEAEHLGKIEGLQRDVTSLRKTEELYVKLVAKTEEDAKAKAESDLVAIVDKAVADGRIEPAKRDSFLEKARKHGGKDFAEAALEDAKPNPVVTTGEKGGSPPVVPAKVVATDAALGKLMAKVGLSDEDLNAAKADGVV